MSNIINLDDLSNLNEIFNNPDNNLNVVDGKYVCYDEDLEILFNNSNISFVKEISKARYFRYDNYYNPVGCCYGDYLSTYVLSQNNKEYYCQVFCVYNGSGADTALLLHNIRKVGEEDDNSSNFMNIAEFAYAIYKQNWLDENTTKEMRLDALRNYYDYQKECKINNYTCDNYDDWLSDVGFDTGCYVCFSEFLDNEYSDTEYMHELLDNEELISLYQDDISKSSN